jgi:probable rRNA maturation factor
VLEVEGVRAGVLSVAYVADAEIAEMNQRFLGHQGPTDVISFALHDPGDAPHGDVYVSADQANRQAGELGIPAAEEWLRLAIHGTLHVLGYDHPDEANRTTSPMYVRQETLLAQVLADLESP